MVNQGVSKCSRRKWEAVDRTIVYCNRKVNCDDAKVDRTAAAAANKVQLKKPDLNPNQKIFWNRAGAASQGRKLPPPKT